LDTKWDTFYDNPNTDDAFRKLGLAVKKFISL